MSTRHTMAAVATLTTGLVLAAPVSAQKTILIDLGRLDGAINTFQSDGNDPSGDRWNDVAGNPSTGFADVASFPTVNDLIDTAGLSTGYSFGLVGTADVPQSSATNMGIGGFDGSALANPGISYPNTAYGDTMFLSFATAVDFELTGLNPAKTYDLNFYGAVNDPDNRTQQRWDVNGTVVTQTPVSSTPDVLPSQVATASGISPDGTGLIDIQWATDEPTSGEFRQGQWNVMEIVESGGGPTLLVDFGQTALATAGNWNNVAAGPGESWATVGDFPTLSNMIDDSGASTGFGFDLVNAVGPPPNGIGAGFASGDNSLNSVGFFSNAERDQLFLVSQDPDGTDRNTTATFELDGLDNSATYDLTMAGFAPDGVFRWGTVWEVNGVSSSPVSTDGENNPMFSADFTDVSPVGGKITITVSTADTGNDDAFGDFNQAHWSLMEVVETPGSVLIGDFNLDGFVGIDDLNIVLANWNATVTPGATTQGDGTGEGFVGIDDLNLILGNWNTGTPPVAVVPEPATLGLLTLGGIVMLRRNH